VHGFDDLAAIDSRQVERRDDEVGVPELSLDHVQRHTLARHFHRVGVAERVWRKAAAHSGTDHKEPANFSVDDPQASTIGSNKDSNHQRRWHDPFK